MANKQNRNWIFGVFLIIGILGTILFISVQTNIFYKNSDFSVNVMFDSQKEGDSGYLTIHRNQKTPSVSDWATFENNDTIVYFSDSFVREKINIDLPEKVESNVYYFNVDVKYVSGYTETKEVSFRVI